jgi:hypothetical protein
VNCIVSGNSALGGGGIANDLGGDLTLMSSTVLGNGASTMGGGGIAAISFTGKTTLINSTISGNEVTGSSGPGGGGISYVGVLTLTGSTVSGNSSSLAGGGIADAPAGFFVTHAVLTNSTVSGNSAATVGGGIYTAGTGATLTLTNSTVVNNLAASQGGGVYHDAGGAGIPPSTLTNTLLARNTAPTAPDLFGTFAAGSTRFNLIGIGNGSSGVSDGVDGNQVGSSSAPLDPRLGALANNGGPTNTHALRLGSPALNAASTPEGPTTDQRGVLRPQGLASDIGSYERKGK